jgi:hypothetical protein
VRRPDERAHGRCARGTADRAVVSAVLERGTELPVEEQSGTALCGGVHRVQVRAHRGGGVVVVEHSLDVEQIEVVCAVFVGGSVKDGGLRGQLLGMGATGIGEKAREVVPVLEPCVRVVVAAKEIENELVSGGHQPTWPSTSSLMRSAWPLWRAYSSIMCT